MRWRRRAATHDEAGDGGIGATARRGSRRGFRWIGGRRYVEGTAYIGAKDAAADHMLDFQHFIIRRILGGNHQSPLRQPGRILDVGCGTGRWAVEMAAEFPGARVVGLDLVRPDGVDPMLATLGPLAANVSLVEADILKGLPVPAGAFDFTHIRLLYSDLPAASWPGVVRDMVRVTRPGGWIECVDQTASIYNPGPAYRVLTDWVTELCRRRGLEPDLGPKLKGLLAAAGAAGVRERIVPSFPNTRMTRERKLWQAQALGVFETIFRDAIVEGGIAPAPEFDAVLRAARAEFESRRYANSDVLYIAYGQRPA